MNIIPAVWWRQLCIVLLLSLLLSWHAIAKPLPLPDRIILNDDVELAPPLDQKIIFCQILEESNDSLIINTSVVRGILERSEIPRASISKVERGEAGTREYATIEELLPIPSDSQPLDYYRNVIDSHLEPFLSAFPDYRYAHKVIAAIIRYQEDEKRILEGQVKADGEWYTEREFVHVLPDLSAKQFRESMEMAAKRGDSFRFILFLEKVKHHKASRYYPEIIETAIEYIPRIHAELNSDGLMQKLNREEAWITSLLLQLEATTKAIKAQEVLGGSLNRGPAQDDYVYDARKRLWHPASIAAVDEETGKVTRLPTASQESRLEEISHEIKQLKFDLAEIQNHKETSANAIATHKKLLQQKLNEYSKIDLKTLRIITTSTDSLIAEVESTSYLSNLNNHPEEDLTMLLENLHQHTIRINEIGATRDKLSIIWPEYQPLNRLGAALSIIDTFLPELKKCHWQKLELLPDDQTLLTEKWMALRKDEASTVIQLAKTLLPTCIENLENRELSQFERKTRLILQAVPKTQSVKTIEHHTTEYFHGLLTQGKPMPARQFMKIVTGLPAASSWTSEWNSEFTWVNLWGYHRFIEQPKVLVIACAVGVTVVLIVTTVLSAYIYLRKRILKRFFKRSW